MNEQREKPRLNPFAFPSETTFRFLLLLVAVTGVSLFLFNWLYFSVSDSERSARKSAACLDQAQQAVAAATTPADLEAASDALTDCRLALARPTAWFMIGGVAVLLAAALVLYLALPRWRLRRARLVPLTAADDHATVAELDALAAEAGLRSPPQWVWNPRNLAPSGLAFGIPRNRRVAVSGGLVMQRTLDPDAFRAVVLHELAHLRNHDVDLTYFTVALWYAFLAVAVAPVVPTLLDEDGETLWSLGWRLAALTLLVYLTRNAVLRAREVYADVRASTFARVRAALRRIHGSRRTRLPLRRRILPLHPNPSSRLRVLDDTEPLFAVGLLEAFAAGIFGTISYQEVVTLVGFLNREWLSTMWLAALAFAPFAAGVVGVGIWRASFAAIARGRRNVRVVPVGVALGGGLLVGQLLSLSSIIAEEDVILDAPLSGADGVWAVIVLGAMACFAAWMASAATLWLPVASASRSPAWTTVLAIAAGGGVLTVSMGIFFLARSTRDVIRVSTAATAAEHDAVARIAWPGPKPVYQFIRDPEIFTFVHRPAVWAAIAALWAFPLAPLLLRRRASHAAMWSTLDGAPAVVLEQPRVDVGRALKAGLVGAAAVLAASLVLRAALHILVSPATREHDAFALAFYVWTSVLALVAMAAVAGVTAARVRGYGVVLGVVAAFVTGLAGAVTLAVYPTLGTCVDVVAVRSTPCSWLVDASFVRQSLEQTIGLGIIVTLGGALAGAAVGETIAKLRQRAPQAVTAA